MNQNDVITTGGLTWHKLILSWFYFWEFIRFPFFAIIILSINMVCLHTTCIFPCLTSWYYLAHLDETDIGDHLQAPRIKLKQGCLLITWNLKSPWKKMVNLERKMVTPETKEFVRCKWSVLIICEWVDTAQVAVNWIQFVSLKPSFWF